MGNLFEFHFRMQIFNGFLCRSFHFVLFVKRKLSHTNMQANCLGLGARSFRLDFHGGKTSPQSGPPPSTHWESSGFFPSVWCTKQLKQVCNQCANFLLANSTHTNIQRENIIIKFKRPSNCEKISKALQKTWKDVFNSEILTLSWATVRGLKRPLNRWHIYLQNDFQEFNIWYGEYILLLGPNLFLSVQRTQALWFTQTRLRDTKTRQQIVWLSRMPNSQRPLFGPIYRIQGPWSRVSL